MTDYLYHPSVYNCYDCGAKPGMSCQTYRTYRAKPAESKPARWHQSRRSQRDRRARPPAYVPARVAVSEALPYARVGLIQ